MLPKIPKHRKPSGSSNVNGYSYDPETQALTVEFHGNRKYTYHAVSADKAASFRDAKSQGTFVNEQLADKHDVTRHLK